MSARPSFDPARVSSSEMARRVREEHLCSSCQHAAVCVAREAISPSHRWYIVISQCAHYLAEPPEDQSGGEVIR